MNLFGSPLTFWGRQQKSGASMKSGGSNEKLGVSNEKLSLSNEMIVFYKAETDLYA